MESDNINLGNMTNGGDVVVAPVSGNMTTTVNSQSYTITNNSTEIKSENLGKVVADESKAENNMVNEVNTKSGDIIYEDGTVPVVIMRKLIADARKVGDYNAIRTISQVIDIELGEFGIKVKASNGKIDYECINNDVKYAINLKACVDIGLVGDLFNKLDCECVKMTMNDGVLEITQSEGSSYKLPEKTDLSTQQPIEIDLAFNMDYADMTSIDLDSLVNSINQSKPVRDIPKIDEEYAGTYFSNLVMSATRSIIYIQDNQPILKTQRFFVGSELCKLIVSLNFNKDKFKIGFTTDSNNDIRAITLSDGKLTICGHVEPRTEIPEDVCEKFWNSQFVHNITVSTKKLTNALERLELFTRNQMNDYSTFEFSNNNLKITADTQNAKENIIVEDNPTNFNGKAQFPMALFKSILNSIKSDKITLSFEGDTINYVGINVDNYRWIVAVVE